MIKYVVIFANSANLKEQEVASLEARNLQLANALAISALRSKIMSNYDKYSSWRIVCICEEALANLAEEE